MDGFAREVLARMPLAEAVLQVWAWIADEEHLAEVFQRCRCRSYEQVLSFPLIVQLMADALLQHEGSGRRSFEHAIENGELPASIQAAYGKLRRLPVELSMGFLTECTKRAEALLPAVVPSSIPSSLEGFSVMVLDGKTIKGVAKRLKGLRHVAGGVVGGKALVGLSLDTGLVIAMHADPDGDVNEVRFVSSLVSALRPRISSPRLWMGDRAFCGLPQLNQFSQRGDAFVVRYRRNVHSETDSSCSLPSGHDGSNRNYVEWWGWLGTVRAPQQLYVRFMTVHRPGEEEVTLVTNLLDATEYPATDLLDLYLARWRIERVFQEVTEVFGLAKLIGSSPRATIFQFAFCLLLYNIIQLLRVHMAIGQSCNPEKISSQKLFHDVRRELIAWAVLLPVPATVEFLVPALPVGELRLRLSTLLASAWTPRWIKTPPHKRRLAPQQIPRARTHASAHRLLNQARSGATRNPRTRQ
jgi:hypothetical protein